MASSTNAGATTAAVLGDGDRRAGPSPPPGATGAASKPSGSAARTTSGGDSFSKSSRRVARSASCSSVRSRFIRRPSPPRRRGRRRTSPRPAGPGGVRTASRTTAANAACAATSGLPAAAAAQQLAVARRPCAARPGRRPRRARPAEPTITQRRGQVHRCRRAAVDQHADAAVRAQRQRRSRRRPCSGAASPSASGRSAIAVRSWPATSTTSPNVQRVKSIRWEPRARSQPPPAVVEQPAVRAQRRAPDRHERTLSCTCSGSPTAPSATSVAQARAGRRRSGSRS